MNKIFLKTLFPFLIGYASCANSAIVLRDNFEYAVNRSDSASCSLFTSTGGWNGVKSNNCGQTSARGFLYTTTTIPGYSQSFPGSNSSRVLGMEAKPYTLQSQTDFYLQFGSGEGTIEIPANHWFQFWVYANNYGAEQSRFSEGKWIYPTRTIYPASDVNQGYVYMFGLAKRSKTTLYADPCPGGDSVGCDRVYINTGWFPNNGGVDNHIPNEGTTFGPNLSTEPTIMPNTWTLVKIHVDISGTDPRAAPGQAVYEQWIRRKGSSQWIKTTEYIGGVTIVNDQPIAFTPRYADGFRMIRMPSTIGATTSAKGDWFDFWLYLDDFVLATSEADLPVYNDGGSTILLSPPTDMRIINQQ